MWSHTGSAIARAIKSPHPRCKFATLPYRKNVPGFDRDGWIMAERLLSERPGWTQTWRSVKQQYRQLPRSRHFNL
jgi:hypothetical protein